MNAIRGLRDLKAFVPGEQPNEKEIIKLNTNENPYPPSPKVSEKLNNFNVDQLKRYSPVEQIALRNAIANHLGITKDMVMIGSGSDEVLAMAFLAFFNNPEPILFPDVTYGFYKVLAELYGIPFQEIPLDESFELTNQGYLQKNGGIVLVNPNAPTGLAKPLTEIEDLLKANPRVMVVVDEAYISFGGQSALSLVKDYPNLFIVRTFSKDASLAGLRVGYGIGHPEIIQLMHAIKDSVNPYNLDSIAEALAIAAVEDWTYYEGTIAAICQTRDWFSQELSQLGYKVLPSSTNFLLVKPRSFSAKYLYKSLKEKHIYTRYFADADRIKDYLRISIGSQEEMESVLSIIRELEKG
ncbi:histidinol-phosphate transaminase [Streptococcus uberis]|uniref:Histidinol-phosphate aminotransferase n=1 Tax=Streptococcus uberis (strain ATCC BAA-854 / 0140J) TaxID=218495 RepID=B9DRQ4_STRU0|nr:histidinol-phosphate transaminase [Streptococcus uberis]KKF48845.1 histidinol-phosphate aminotransferase [Streptococcus uberis C8329]KKF53758.1 histidinol-phosphate aminotransferase [Streptococcus uberis B190]CAR41488.1 putative histidinol-phosphate aminotransferase [Streptococcus uberis 0140J]